MIIKAVVTPDQNKSQDTCKDKAKLSPMDEQRLIQKALDQVQIYHNRKKER